MRLSAVSVCVFLLAGASLGCAPATPPPTSPVAAPTAAQPAAAAVAPAGARVVAVGDLHADLETALAVLRLAGVVDAEGRWSGGTATLVQTGDITDRGPDSLEVIPLLQRREGEAAAAGGQVVALMGNHEAMNLTGDWRYVSPEDVADFGDEAARRAAFSAEGALGAWLLSRDAVAVVGGVVFVHGGVSAATARAAAGAVGRPAWVREALAGRAPEEVLGPEGPLWYRGYLQAPEAVACAELAGVLEALGAERMVVGHTTQRTGRVAARCGGRLLGIDTGISRHYGGHLAAVELVGRDAAALYPEGREDLPDP